MRRSWRGHARQLPPPLAALLAQLQALHLQTLLVSDQRGAAHRVEPLLIGAALAPDPTDAVDRVLDN